MVECFHGYTPRLHALGVLCYLEAPTPARLAGANHYAVLGRRASSRRGNRIRYPTEPLYFLSLAWGLSRLLRRRAPAPG